MRRSQVIGLPVLTEADAEPLGTVADLLVSAHDGRVIGLLLTGGGALSGHRIYPYEEVRAIGNGAVLVGSPSALLTTRRSGAVRQMLNRHTDLVGKRLIDENGDDLGIIGDLEFDPETGAIAGYQVSGGFVHDVLEGKGFIPVSAGLTPGKGAVLCTRGDGEARI